MSCMYLVKSPEQGKGKCGVRARTFFINYQCSYLYTYYITPVIRAIGVSHTACKDEFRQDNRSTAGVYYNIFHNNTTYYVILIFDVHMYMYEIYHTSKYFPFVY